MGNEFEKIAEDVLHVVEWPFKNLPKIIEVTATALKDEPKVASAITGLLTQIGTLAKDGALAVGASGLNISEDMLALSDAKTLFGYVESTFLPQVKQVFSEVQADIDVPNLPSTPISTPQPGEGDSGTVTASTQEANATLHAASEQSALATS